MYTYGVVGLIVGLATLEYLEQQEIQAAAITLLGLAVIGGVATITFYVIDYEIDRNHKDSRANGRK